MSEDQPPTRDTDLFAPPAIPTLVGCLHCHEEYESYLIEWRVERNSSGQIEGIWRCPTPGCDAIGFGFDILPCDPTYQDEHGGWIQNDEAEDEFDDEFEPPPSDSGKSTDGDDAIPW